ncbi:ABC transporter ATP-binding protein [Flavipsychrobacter stenotrophus]|uniref:ABC transporter ATP-binding protein n=1 Tax=Flavipsychrobacter stenotrophus TaxID=2077091 RepID=A0A2S7SYF3_9BACT|nr:polysaccharide ABC transporter ATP-binding protein [Flavipsychrobacter stenotrophus]PQJ11647.1 ABC transporter ATP-binding protein [Flavipsychrobacter stenotrophus]
MSKDIVIRIENVSKQYRLGQIGTGTLSHDLKRWWALTRGKEDPYLKIGVENDRTSKASSEYAWALRDISFEVNQGDTLGIIGKNGAGKSTLLKVLSRVTAPTTGQMKIRGRIAALLEVGTGFHPELTGKENIYLNGAIMGMTKKEISRKFDEIVDFAGVQLYINTPVKRYSSGMYVRLAFGVAAHLESEILIIDEVLAVGDAEFQKKCLGKMGDVAGDGRTVIFVSHNMQAVQSLCSKTIYMKSGKIADIGPTDQIINSYLSREVNNRVSVSWDNMDDAPGNSVVKITGAEIIAQNQKEDDPITIKTEIWVKYNLYLLKEMNTNLSVHFNTASGLMVFNAASPIMNLAAGHHSGTMKIPGNLLNNDIYSIRLLVVKDGTTIIYSIDDLLTFEISDIQREGNWFGKWEGVIRPILDFTLI